ncbi:hypothetical protein GPECTOR_39g423 [Gonium pectorale]|uniref:PPIase cyclophilin-type domain-containing protein n=1 Tax=Gonium pectorale TaxID=33097 RepID=A0A150GAR7_GONPE|nr:hypothetical protein GPECTOR_39g423 [Gonium pectorale]|eukprot:KXZ46929.1 hypothetical protein GPECTOR_39g423 [Gonium pectorale]
MIWSLQAVHRQDVFLQPRRLGEAGSVIVGGAKLAAQGLSVPASGSSGEAAAEGKQDVCHVDENNEYHGDVVTWGEKNIKARPPGGDGDGAANAGECCDSCAATPGCNIWVYCSRAEGCGHTGNIRPQGECWLKRNKLAYVMANAGQGHPGISWTAGALYTAQEHAEYVKQHEAELKAEADRLLKLKNDPELPLVWFDVALNGTRLGRIEMVLFVKESPRAGENMRQLCSGEKGGKYTLKADRFIDQTGAAADGIFDGEFHDDPGGLKLKHTHKGLLSMANSGPNTNGGHFSLIMGPAHHLDGSYTIFGEIVSGIEVAEQVNHLAQGHQNNELLSSTAAQIVDAGQVRPGSYVSTPEFKAVMEAEKRRIAWRSKQSSAELGRLRKLYDDKSLPMVFFEVAIKGVYAGRIEMVLFVKESPLAAENFRLLCTGEAGVAPAGHEGAGHPYHFKGVHFYRIIDGFIDQAGQVTDSPLGGLFLDDAGGLKLNHTHMGLLSMANMGPNTNGAHFSIIMGAPHHLDGHYTIFGEVVDGHNVAYEINALAQGQADKQLLNSKDAQIIDSGEVRRGTHWDSREFQAAVNAERERLKAAHQAPK